MAAVRYFATVRYEKKASAYYRCLLGSLIIRIGSWWNRVGDFWLESAKKAGIAGGFCILKVAIFGMNSGWHEHRNAAGGYGIRIRSQAFARSRRCAEFSVIRRRA